MAPGIKLALCGPGLCWLPNEDADTVVEFTKDQLTSSGKPAPAVMLSSNVLDAPWGTAFDSSGNLVVTNYTDGTIAKFSAMQLKASGAPTPEVSVTGPDI